MGMQALLAVWFLGASFFGSFEAETAAENVAGAIAADVIPGDEVCKPWEHWEGHHSGRCEFGCRCAAPGAGLGDPPAAAAVLLVGFGALLWWRRR